MMRIGDMRLWALGSASVLALASPLAPASAQSSSPSAPQPPSGSGSIADDGARASPAATAQAAGADTDAAPASDIIVTGVRESLRRAQDIKRDADSVVEVVTANDLGAFDDNNVADVLQRVPGLQIERDDASTDGDRVSIRGIGSNFVVTSFGGRTPISPGSGGERNLRSFNYNLLPTELIAGLVVSKTPTADRIEQGLAGSIDIQTLQPLSASYRKGENFFGSAEVRGIHNDFAGSVLPRASFIGGGRNKDRTLGFYLTGVYGKNENPVDQLQNRDGYTPGGTAGRATFRVDTNNNGIYDNGDTFYSNGQACAANGFAPVLTAPTGANLTPTPPIGLNDRVTCDATPFDIFNGIVTYRRLNRTQTTRGLAGAIQWKPTDNLDIIVDYQHAAFEEAINTQAIALNLNSTSAPVNNTTAFFKPGAVYVLDDGPTDLGYISGWDGAGLIGYLGAENSGAGNTTSATNTNFKDLLQVTNSVGNFSNQSQLDMGGIKMRWKGDRLSVSADGFYSRTTYNSIFSQVELRQRYRNAYSLGDVGFNIIDGYPVTTNLDKLNLGATPTIDGPLNSIGCATRICTEYNGLGSHALGTTPLAQFTNAWNNAINQGSAVRKAERKFTGDAFAVRADAVYELEGGFFRTLETGIRFNRSDMDSIVSVNHRYAGRSQSTTLGIGCTLQQGVGCLTQQQAAYVAAITQGGFATIGGGTPAAVTVLNLDEAAACAFNPGFCEETLDNGGLIPRPNNSFTYKEDLLATYLATKFRGRLIVPFTGNIGVRAVQTRWTSTAGTVISRNIVIPTTGTAPVVENCRASAPLSSIPGNCALVSLLPGTIGLNNGTGVLLPNGNYTTGSTGALTRPLTDEASTYLDAVYYSNALGSLRNPFTTTVGGRYVDLLPSLNLNFSLARNLRMRFGFGTVVSRPQPNEIAPTSAVGINDNDTFEASIADDIVAALATGLTYEQALNSEGVRAVIAANPSNIITQGNPTIKPYRAKNYDLTFEYYTRNGGSIVIGGFLKDISGFIVQRLNDELVFVPGYVFDSQIDDNTIAINGRPIPFRVRRYENFSDALVYGFEASINQPFSFLPAPFDGFGINANYTYVDSSFEQDIGNFGFGFPGSSKNNYNAVLYFDSRFFDFRVAYNRRDPYVRALAGAGSQSNLTRFTDTQQRLDVSMTLKPTTHWLLRFTAANLTNQDRYDYSFSRNAVMERFSGARTFTLSARYRF